MEEVNEDSWITVQQIQKELNAYVGMKSPESPEHINQLLASFRSASEAVIFRDFEFATTKGVENRLWDAHGKVNGHYRKQLRHLREANGKRKSVEQRKSEKQFLDFIKSSQRFYRGYIQTLGSRFEGVDELNAVANRLTLSTLSAHERVAVAGNLRRFLLLSCHQTLIRLGDLSRWRETQLVAKDRNWGPAIGYYDLASRIYAASGASHNQLAVIALLDMNHLRAVYHLYRAIVVEEPHPNAKGNLEVEFKKIEGAWGKGELLTSEGARDSQAIGKGLIGLFLRLHARCYKGFGFPEHEELESEVLSQLSGNLKERSIDAILSKMVLINIAAEYFATQRRETDSESSEAQKSFFALQRLNVRTFFTLFQVLEPDLVQYVSHGFSSGSSSSDPLSPKISVVARRVLPALRQYSSWLTVNASLLATNHGNDDLKIQIGEFWRIYANVLTLLASIFSLEELQTAELSYLLAEDEDTLGFLPFRHDDVGRRYIREDLVSQKPRHHDQNVELHHPNTEMLGRVRELLTDGMRLCVGKRIPITLTLVGPPTFAYSDDDKQDLSSLLPINAHQEDVTHVDETSFPDPLSLAASAPIAMDIDSQRMVDDLVTSEAEDQAETTINPLGITVGNDTSYGVIDAATVLEHFGHGPIGGDGRRSSRRILPSIENSPFAVQPEEEQLLASPRSPIKQDTPTHSRHNSQKGIAFQQQPGPFGISPTNSSMPTPTFQNTKPELAGGLPANAVHPGVHARNVQKALDETIFHSSSHFPGSPLGNAPKS